MSQSELDPRNQEAIQAALEGGWDKAATLNSQLFEEYPEDIDIINRLAKAFTELGQINKAKSTYEKVLELDPYNPIAMRSLDRLSTLRGVKTKEISAKPVNLEVFLEEPGKTKIIEVIDLAMPQVLINLRVGDNIELRVNKEEVAVISEEGRRLGKLEPTWGKEISQAIDLGSTFNTVIKSVQVSKDQKNTSLTVFVRELTRSNKLINPLFPFESNNFTPYVRENTLSYLKNEEPVLAETTDETQEIEVDEIPEDEETFAEVPPSEDVIEDEEDFSQTNLS